MNNCELESDDTVDEYNESDIDSLSDDSDIQFIFS